MRALRRTGGFTLLELLAAIVIFAGMAVAVIVAMDTWTDRALRSVRARELRMLAERKLGEIAVFEKEFDDIYDNEAFGDEYGEEWEGWEWSLYIRDVVIFGETNDEAAEYLFGAPDEDDEDEQDEEANQQQGETQFLRELTLTVRAPADGESGGIDDSVTVVTFLPLVDHGPTAPTGNNPGGGN
jgi:prepilin-type N-terminal cleavage/methylation domain-containing protein